jgi:hypothetical protein
MNRWYNTTYTLYASMILLYVVLTNMPSIDRQSAIKVVEKSLEIFNAMNMVGVARRGAEITHEVLEIAKRSAEETKMPPESTEQLNNASPSTVLPGFSAPGPLDFAGYDLSKEDLYASLVDVNIMDGFAEFDSGYFDMPDFNSVLASGPIS